MRCDDLNRPLWASVCLIIAVIWIFLPGPVSADGLPSSGSGSLFDPDDTLEMEDELFEELPAPEANASFFSVLKNHSKCSLGQQLSWAVQRPVSQNGSEAANAPDPFEMVTHTTWYRHEFEHLFQGNLFMRFDGKLFMHWPDDHRYTTPSRVGELTGKIREWYVQAGYDRLSLTLGKKITIWGKADASVVTDLVSPRDLTDFMFTRIEDSRSGQYMAALDLYSDRGNLFFYLSPAPEPDRVPEIGNRYHIPTGVSDPVVYRTDHLELGDIETGIRYAHTIEKTDFSLLAGRFYDNSGILDEAPVPTGSTRILTRTFLPFTAIGGDINLARSNFLYKIEAAWKHDHPVQNIDSMGRFCQEEATLLDVAAGVEYLSNDQLSLSLECSHRQIIDTPLADHLYRENETAFYSTLSKDFLNQTLKLEFTTFFHLQDHDLFNLLRLTYDLTDWIQIEAGLGIFTSRHRDSLLYPFRNEDRFSLELTCHF